MDLKAKLWPFPEKNEGVDIVIYVVTGRHGIINIPESFCKECNMFYQAAKQAEEKLAQPVNIYVRSWWTGFPYALLKGGYHPPVMFVDGKKLAQGYDVPDAERVVQAVKNSD